MSPILIDPHMHDAITDLHAYVLVLDAERQRLRDQVGESAPSSLDPEQRAQLESRHAEMEQELDALRATILALRKVADPAGRML